MVLHSGVGVVNQRQQFVQAGVHIGFGDLAGLDSGQQFPHGVTAGGGHFQRGAVLYAQCMVVGAAPVGNDSAGKAPIPAQDVLQQMGVLVGVGAVDQIVAGHDGFGCGFFHHDLKAGQVDLPQGAFVQHGVRRHAAQLLAVDGEVLGAGGDAFALDAPHIACGHLARKVRVLGEVLEVTAAERAALGVEARPQQYGNFLRGGFLTHGLADFLAKFRVPAACHGDSRGKAGSRHAGVQPQMVRRPGLLAHAAGAIG